MVSMMSLWMPIVLSAVAVFLLSWVVHTMLPYHKGDYAAVPSEDAVMDALRKFDSPPGDYMMPRATGMADMKSPEYNEKLNKGPVAVFTVMPSGPMAMGAQLGQWFVYSVVVSVFAAYVASRAVVPGAIYLEVFRFVGVTAFACYGVALWQDSIWYKRKWSTTVKSNFDALLYALVTAGVFGWLWPN
jgi:hypothetical protein